MLELTGFVQKYDWGKVGPTSIAAILYGEDIDPYAPYAELWMGTHPNGNATIKEYDVTLHEYIKHCQEVLGSALPYWKKYNALPFLMKVLSIKKALSIQCHPHKEMAEILHNNFPKMYKDPNHKPEMAIALTKFNALCGFRPVEEIKEFCVSIIELQYVITPSFLESYRTLPEETLLKKMLLSLMTKSEDVVENALGMYFHRLEVADDDTKEKQKYSLVKKLHDQFPGDVGIFMVFFLNEVWLQPHEAMYIPPGIPHAYISGDCVECMATSDNVVRAGLTPKYKDIETLLDILDYQSYESEGVKFKSEQFSEFTTSYNPPIPDFGVSRVCIPEQTNWFSPSHDSCMIFFVLEGEGVLVGEKMEKPKGLDKPEPQIPDDVAFKIPIPISKPVAKVEIKPDKKADAKAKKKNEKKARKKEEEKAWREAEENFLKKTEERARKKAEERARKMTEEQPQKQDEVRTQKQDEVRTQKQDEESTQELYEEATQKLYQEATQKLYEEATQKLYEEATQELDEEGTQINEEEKTPILDEEDIHKEDGKKEEKSEGDAHPKMDGKETQKKVEETHQKEDEGEGTKNEETTKKNEEGNALKKDGENVHSNAVSMRKTGPSKPGKTKPAQNVEVPMVAKKPGTMPDYIVTGRGTVVGKAVPAKKSTTKVNSKSKGPVIPLGVFMNPKYKHKRINWNLLLWPAPEKPFPERRKKVEAKPEYKACKTHTQNIKLGSIIFLPARKRYLFTATRGPLILYFAYFNSDCFMPEVGGHREAVVH